MTIVLMINSVADLVAGEEYELPDEEGDRYILLGYASGDLSRAYSTGEAEDLTSGGQSVSV